MVALSEMRRDREWPLQRIFNRVARHLIRQGETSEAVAIMDGVPQNVCRLRATGERTGACLSCAVGCLIPEPFYRLRLEESSQVSAYMANDRPLRQLLEQLGYRLPETLAFLGGLQNLHDRVPVKNWALALLTFARDNDLDGKVVYRAYEQNPRNHEIILAPRPISASEGAMTWEKGK